MVEPYKENPGYHSIERVQTDLWVDNSTKSARLPPISDYYEYKALDRGQIRILKLKHGYPGSSLHGSLKAVARDEARATYRALSYTWGSYDVRTFDDTQTPILQYIFIDGRPLAIRPNLYLFLRRLRDPVKDVLLWADAICIGQSNTPEKGYQVAMMSQIYSSAISVFVWLGTGNPEMGLLFAPEQVGELPEFTAEFDENRTAKFLAETGEYPGDVFDRFLKLGYWKRRWILQEIFLASVVVVYMEEFSLSLEDINIRCGYLARSLRRWDLLTISTLGSILRQRSGRKLMTFPEVLRLYGTGTHHCSDVRDRVYGLFGLVDLAAERHIRANAASNGIESHPVPVDYAATTIELFHRVVAAYITLPVDELAGPLIKALELSRTRMLQKSSSILQRVPVLCRASHAANRGEYIRITMFRGADLRDTDILHLLFETSLKGRAALALVLRPMSAEPGSSAISEPMWTAAGYAVSSFLLDRLRPSTISFLSRQLEHTTVLGRAPASHSRFWKYRYRDDCHVIVEVRLAALIVLHESGTLLHQHPG